MLLSEILFTLQSTINLCRTVCILSAYRCSLTIAKKSNLGSCLPALIWKKKGKNSEDTLPANDFVLNFSFMKVKNSTHALQ